MHPASPVLDSVLKSKREQSCDHIDTGNIRMASVPNLQPQHRNSPKIMANSQSKQSHLPSPISGHSSSTSTASSSASQYGSPNPVLKVLFGQEVTEWNFSEENLSKALELRMCQERTKQEYYKVERLNRSIELMKLAAMTKVPGDLIPNLFGNLIGTEKGTTTDLKTPFSKSDDLSISANYSPSNSPSPVRNSGDRLHQYHRRSRTISNITEINSSPKYTQKQAPNSMSSFKFGGNSVGNTLIDCSKEDIPMTPPNMQRTHTLLRPKHQLSPSRIGAHAIASLSRHPSGKKTVNINDFRHGSSHQRTLSLPATVSIPETKPLVFHNHENDLSRFNKGAIKYSYTHNETMAQIHIPNLEHNSKSPFQSGKYKVNNNILDASNESSGEEDVEKLLEVNPKESSPPKRRKMTSGSPLREIAADAANDSFSSEKSHSALNLHSASSELFTYTSSTPNRLATFEPKTP